MASSSFRWLLQLHKDVPKAAKFYSQGLDFSVNICTLRWAELQSGPLKLALMQSPCDNVIHNGSNSSVLSFTVNDINSTVTKLMALGAELDGPIKYQIHGKVAAMRCIDGHMVGLYEPSRAVYKPESNTTRVDEFPLNRSCSKFSSLSFTLGALYLLYRLEETKKPVFDPRGRII